MFAIVNDDLNIKDAGHKEKGANEDQDMRNPVAIDNNLRPFIINDESKLETEKT